MIHSANPDHSKLAVPQSLFLGNGQQLAEVISQHPHFKYPNELDLALNLGLHIRFYCSQMMRPVTTSLSWSSGVCDVPVF